MFLLMLPIYFICLFNFPSTYWGKYLNTLEFLQISIIYAYCMFSMNKKYFPYPKESTDKISQRDA